MNSFFVILAMDLPSDSFPWVHGCMGAVGGYVGGACGWAAWRVLVGMVGMGVVVVWEGMANFFCCQRAHTVNESMSRLAD